ncbi:MAG: tol-pal system protein YbgF [Myxococcales bacterium]|nr:tol-pal system protein YbgF [Myxococcales bacterium]MDH3483603.1 tol-pal system protein YbgF [Myxococcales bacterium]
MRGYAVKRLVTVVGWSTLIGCSSVGVHSRATDASSAASAEAEVTALRAQLEEQSDELRTLRGQLALARAEVQELRGEARQGDDGDPRESPGTKKAQKLPWLEKPVTVRTEDGEREVLELLGEERLSTTTDIPDLPAFIEEETLGATTLTDSGVEDYRRGLSLVREREFDEALIALTAFLDVYPDHPYADNALFWRGEVYFLRREYGRALKEFQAVEKQYPWGNKLPDALYRIGQIHLKRGDKARARAYFDKVRDQFPDTAAARLALREDAS